MLCLRNRLGLREAESLESVEKTAMEVGLLHGAASGICSGM